MKNFIIAILTVVIGGLLLKLGEIKLTNVLSEPALSASAVVGPYAVVEKDKDDLFSVKTGTDAYSSIAVVKITNNTVNKAQNIQISINTGIIDFLAISETDSIKRSQIVPYTGKTRASIKVPDLNPGETADVTILADTHSIIDFVRTARIYSNVGAAYISYKGVDSSGDVPLNESFFGFLWENVAYVGIGLLLFVIALQAYSGHQSNKYWKMLFRDEGYYLSEAERFHKEGDSFELPYAEIDKG